MNIKTLILKSGMELISEIVKAHDRMDGSIDYELKRPFKLEAGFIPVQGPQGAGLIPSPELMPLLMTSISQTIIVSSKDLLCPPLETKQQVSAVYFKQNTGLELASAGSSLIQTA